MHSGSRSVDPAGILEGEPCGLLSFLIAYSVDDERGDLAHSMKRVFEQLPRELSAISSRYDWALTRGYLLKGTRGNTCGIGPKKGACISARLLR